MVTNGTYEVTKLLAEYWHMDIGDRYFPLVIATDQGWRYDVGIKITFAGMVFYAHPLPVCEDIEETDWHWRLTDEISGRQAFLSKETFAYEKLNENLESVLISFAILLSQRFSGDIEEVKRISKSKLDEYEKTFGIKPELTKEMFDSVDSLYNKTGLVQ